MPIGFTMPFQRSSGSLGLFQTTEDEIDATRQNVRSLLVTNWGERVMHYHFGCNMIEFLFEQMRGDSLRGRITDRIVEQVSTWLPFVTIESVNVLFSDDDISIPEHGVAVKMTFKLQNRPDVLVSIEQLVSP